MLAIVTLTAILAAQAPAAPALRIVVIEGEDAVNVIQQKTAVRPVIEVRDRNNLPVSGAIVTFSIEGGKAASFGGASTLTIATNAAGQATVTGLTPSAAGAFQIQVSAAFQGQVATATIAQTNVVTAAGATGASGASGAGGGGLSATTIGIVGAAVAGGAVAATQIGNRQEEQAEGEQVFNGSFTGPVVSTLVSRNSGASCTINRTVTGTATIKLDINTSTNVSGRLQISGTDAVVAQTCPATNSSTPFAVGTAISGSPSSIRGSESHASNSTGAGGETIQGTGTVFFEGSLNGNTITGTIRHEQNSVATGGGGGPVDQSASGTFPVTLTKS